MTWDTRLIRSFLVLADELHFGRAADRLNLSQPALTRQIQELERRVGTPLLIRQTRSVMLTEPGDLLRRELPSALHGLDTLLDQARRIGRGDQGQVRIGFIGSAVETVLTDLLQRTHELFPALAFTLIERPWVQQTAGLETGQDDLALVRDLRDSLQWTLRPLHSEPICLVMPAEHHLADRTQIEHGDLNSLADVPFLSNTDWIARHCAQWPFRPQVLDDVGSTHAVLALVRARQGISFMPKSYLTWATPDLRFIPVAGHTTTQQVAWNARSPSSARQIVLAQLGVNPDRSRR